MDERIAAVQRMQDYIEAHLEEEITPAKLARAAMYSPWYAARIFREMTGLAPAAYIRRLRLARSALRIKDGSRITDAAYAQGFGSADGYTRAFRREYGMNPVDYARHPVPISLFVPFGVQYRTMRKDVSEMDEVKSVFVQVVKKPRRRAIIKRGIRAEEYWSYCEEVGCDIWGVLLSMDSEPVCMWLPEKYRRPGTSKYVQGIETTGDMAVPDGFDAIELPEAEYLMFQGEPFEEKDFIEAIVNVQRAMDRYAPSVLGYAWDDDQPRIQLEPRGERGYIELRAVKRI